MTPTKAELLVTTIHKNLLGDGSFERELALHQISVLRGFEDNRPLMLEFYRRMYGDSVPPIALCGLNPGRFGAGKTGVPFLDFSSLSKLISGVDRHDSERSAQFFYSIVEKLGPERFFKTFYVTNVCPVGFVKDGKNLNYDSLPDSAQRHVENCFREEMRLMGSTRIISLSAVVHRTVQSIFLSGIDVATVLRHPNFCAFPRKIEATTREYRAVLAPLLLPQK